MRVTTSQQRDEWMRRLPLVAAAFVCLHVLSILLLGGAGRLGSVASYPFLMTVPWLAAAACWWRWLRVRTRTGTAWALLAGGLTLWAVGMVFSVWEDYSMHGMESVAYSSDFMFYVYGVPVMLAISAPVEGEETILFQGLDALQAGLGAVLVYVMLFGALPFGRQAITPISATLLVVTYNVENLVLACAAGLRLLGGGGNVLDREFRRKIAVYLCVYAVCAGIYNWMAMRLTHTGLWDVMVDVPFLLLAVYAMSSEVEVLPRLETKTEGESKATVMAYKRPIAMFIENGGPILYTLALLALGAWNMRQHFRLGAVSIATALAVYVVRTTILQGRYLRSQFELREARDRLEKISLSDALTGLANRRSFDQTIEAEWGRAYRSKQPLSLLLVDLDHFKQLNDNYGHRTGDQCLARAAQALRLSLTRGTDFIARYGGEEFVALLPSTSREGAERVAAKMRLAVRGLRLSDDLGHSIRMTVSIGVASFTMQPHATPAALVEAADRGLYKAKQSGRDRVEYYPMEVVLQVLAEA